MGALIIILIAGALIAFIVTKKGPRHLLWLFVAILIFITFPYIVKFVLFLVALVIKVVAYVSYSMR